MWKALPAFASGVAGSYIEVPEFGPRDWPSNSCPIRITIRQEDPQIREAQLLRFVEESYEHTNAWSKDYIIAGVDYASFRAFYMIILTRCSDMLKEQIALSLSHCIGKRDKCLFIDQLDFAREDNSRLVGEPSVMSGQTGAIIEQYFGLNKVKSCAIRVRIRADNDEQLWKIHSEILKVWGKYRLPFIDTPLRNNTIYFILSRQCAAREKIYATFIKLLASQTSISSLGPPEFDPDLSEYLFSVTGKKFD